MRWNLKIFKKAFTHEVESIQLKISQRLQIFCWRYALHMKTLRNFVEGFYH